jgi:hypothetical protein
VLRYEIDKERRLVTLTADGMLMASEVLKAQDQLRRDPAFNPSYRMLADYLAITGSNFNRHNMAEIARNAPFGPTSRRAFVVRGKLGFGLARMFGTISEVDTQTGLVRVFDNDLDAALRWLDGAAM